MKNDGMKGKRDRGRYVVDDAVIGLAKEDGYVVGASAICARSRKERGGVTAGTAKQ